MYKRQGVHSHIEHLFALLQMAKDKGLTKVYVHCFLDGRDVSPTSGKGFVQELQDKCAQLGVGRIDVYKRQAYTFAKAQGGSIGKSLCEPDKLDYALQMIQKAKDRGVQLLLPTDTVAAAEFSADADSLVVPTDAIPDDMEGLDIGPETIRTFCAAVRGAGTVVWNGPMGF